LREFAYDHTPNPAAAVDSGGGRAVLSNKSTNVIINLVGDGDGDGDDSNASVEFVASLSSSQARAQTPVSLPVSNTNKKGRRTKTGGLPEGGDQQKENVFSIFKFKMTTNTTTTTCAAAKARW
jgi:hypothetical protein